MAYDNNWLDAASTPVDEIQTPAPAPQAPASFTPMQPPPVAPTPQPVDTSWLDQVSSPIQAPSAPQAPAIPQETLENDVLPRLYQAGAEDAYKGQDIGQEYGPEDLAALPHLKEENKKRQGKLDQLKQFQFESLKRDLPAYTPDEVAHKVYEQGFKEHESARKWYKEGLTGYNPSSAAKVLADGKLTPSEEEAFRKGLREGWAKQRADKGSGVTFQEGIKNEGLFGYAAERTPVIGTIKSGVDYAHVNSAFKRVKAALDKGERPDPKDMQPLNEIQLQAQYLQARGGETAAKKFLDGVLHLPGVITEFILTGGVGTASKTAARVAVKKLLGESSKKLAGRLAVQGVGLTAKALTMAAIQPTTYAKFLKNLTPEYQVNDRGEVIVGKEKSTAKEFIRAIGDQAIDNFAQIEGARSLGMVIERVPVLSSLQKMYQAIGGKQDGFVQAMSSKAGFHGLLENMGANRLGEVVKAAVNIHGSESGILGRIKESLPGKEDLAIEAATLTSIPLAHRAVETSKNWSKHPAFEAVAERASSWVEKNREKAAEIAKKVRPSRGDFEKAGIQGKYDSDQRAMFTDALRNLERLKAQDRRDFREKSAHKEAIDYFDENFGPEAIAKAQEKPLAQKIYEEIGHDAQALKEKARETGVTLPPLIPHKEAAEIIAKKVESKAVEAPGPVYETLDEWLRYVHEKKERAKAGQTTIEPTAQQKKDLTRLLDNIDNLNTNYQDVLARFADEVSGQHVKGVKAKSQQRILEKVNNPEDNYNGDVTLVKDILRGTVIVKTIEAAREVLKKAESKFKVTRVKNRFDDFGDDGYRDILINIDYEGRNTELQIHIPEMQEAKEGKHTVKGFSQPVSGHDLYEISAAAKKSDKAMYKEVMKLTRELYDGAMKKYEQRIKEDAQPSKVQNSASLIETPLRDKAEGIVTASSKGTNLPVEDRPLPSEKTKYPSSPVAGRTSKEPSFSQNSEPVGKEAGTDTERIIEVPSTSNIPQNSQNSQSGGTIQAKAEALERLKENSGLNSDPSVLAEWGYSPKFNTVGIRYEGGDWRIPNTEYPMYGKADQVTDWVSVGVEKPKEKENVRGSRGTRGRVEGPPPVRDQDVENKPTESVPQNEESGNTARSGVSSSEGTSGDAAESPRAGNEPPRSIESINQGTRSDSGRRGDESEQRSVSAKPTEKTDSLNYRITDEDRIGEGGKKAKYHENVAAIKLLKKIESEGRKATAAEQAVLVKYVGWGGLKEVFSTKESQKGWDKEREEIKNLLDYTEYSEASSSTQNAHYTSPEVIKAIWKGIESAGFQGGTIIEPAFGAGHFYGLMPDSIMKNSKLFAIEKDSITSRIAEQLYQGVKVVNAPFQDIRGEAKADLIISNVPFANVAVRDSYDRKLKANTLHDFFFLKAINMTKPGGLVAFITSRGTMDKADSTVRRSWLKAGAEFVGAVRLPYTAFKGNAGTEVVTDLVILRKMEPDELSIEIPHKKLEKVKNAKGEEFEINEYFVAHPENILGELALTGTMYGPEKQLNVEPKAGTSLGEQISTALERMKPKIKSDVYDNTDRMNAPDFMAPKLEGPHKDGEMYIEDGKVKYIQHNVVQEVDFEGARIERLKGLLDIRKSVRTLLNLEASPEATDKEIEAERKNLNKIYDQFVEKFKPISTVYNQATFKYDNDFALLLSLENYNKEAKTAKKADIFSKRVLSPAKKITATNPVEALTASLQMHGKVNLDYMSELIGKPKDEIFKELEGLVFKTPEGDYESAEKYLSGNVRRKLVAAKQAGLKKNVEALEKVQPVDLEPHKISIRLGMPWIPAEVYTQFIREELGRRVELRNVKGDWYLEAQDRMEPQAKETYDFGIQEYPALDIIKSAMNHKTISVFTGKGEEAKLNVDKTAAARSAEERLQDRFKAWLWEDTQRAVDLARIYNDNYNNTVDFAPKGDHLTFPGANPIITERDYRKNAVWRFLTTGNTLIAHAVGAGKTWTMAAMIMEGKRIGLHKKAVLVIPKHLAASGQWAKEFLQAYPGAKLLNPGENDFEPAKRMTLANRIRTGDWDVILVPHTSFTKMPMSPHLVKAKFESELKALEADIKEARTGKADRNIIAQIEKSKENLKNKMTTQLNQQAKDKGPYFDELGIDAIFVDESHEYKNLWFRTKMGRVPGVSTDFVQKSFDMDMKVQYINKLSGGKSVVFATGTPISNSMTEMYTMQHYLQPGMLRERGIDSFDSWAHQFGQVVTNAEVKPTGGGGLRMHSRFAKFINVPELTQMFRATADILTSKNLKIKRPPHTLIQVPKPMSNEQRNYLKTLDDRSKAIKNKTVDPSEDNMLSITNDGREAALDMRRIDPTLPDYEGSKLNEAVQRVYEIWDETVKDRSTQIIWLDRGVPPSSKPKPGEIPGFNLYADIKAKLVAKGIPADEIQFIQDHEGDKKRTLFDNFNTGKVRILLGSTLKMGTGANIQRKLIAAHHLDAPWRPSDIEQRDGRIIRNGNENEKGVRILRYVTQGDAGNPGFDTYMWQTLSRKAGFIEQIMDGDPSVREMEDVSSASLSFAEMTAIASGDPRIFEWTKLDSQVRTLAAERSHYESTRFSFRKDLLNIPDAIRGFERTLERTNADAKKYEKNKTEKPEFTIAGKTYAETKDAGEALMKQLDPNRTGAIEVGSVYGFKLILHPDTDNTGKPSYRIMIEGEGTYQVQLSDSASGNITRILNGFKQIEADKKTAEQNIENTRKREKEIKARVDIPFAKEALYQEKKAASEKLKHELSLDKRDVTEDLAPTTTVEEEADTDSEDGDVKAPKEKTEDTEDTGVKYSLKMEPNERLNQEDLTKAFPGASVSRFNDGSGYRVTFKGGHYVDVKVVDNIAVNWEAAEKGLGRKIPPSERKLLKAAGSFEVRTKDGKKLDGIGLLQLSRSMSDSGTLRHESLHLAKALGLFTDAEWNALVKEYSDPSKTLAQQEEDIADARGAWKGEEGLSGKLKSWGKSLLKQFGITSGVSAYDVQRAMDDAAFWQRTPKVVNGRSTITLTFGRPDLANPAKSQEVRDLVDKADEARKMAGVPGHWVKDPETGMDTWESTRSDATVQKQAQELLDSHYIKTRNDLLKKAQSGEQLSDVETIAAKEIINREGQKAIKSGNPERIKQAVALIDAYRRTGTEQARALRQRRDPVETPRQRNQRSMMEAMLTPDQKTLYKIEEARKNGKQDEIARLQAEWAEKIEGVKYELKRVGIDAEKLEEIAEDDVKTARVLQETAAAKADMWDAAYEYWSAGLLWGLATQTANTAGNTLHSGWHFTAERFTEALVNSLARRPEGMQWGEYTHILAGILPGISEGAKNAVMAWHTEVSAFEGDKTDNHRAAISGEKGRFIRMPFRGLKAADDFAKTMIARMEVGAQAYRIAKAEKKSGAELQKRIQELMSDLESPAWGSAIEHARLLAFGQKSKTLDAVIDFREKVFPLKFLIPYVSAPYNIFKTGIKKSPLGSLAVPLQVYRAAKTGNWTGVPASVAQQVIAWGVTLALINSNDEKDPWITGANVAGSSGERALDNRTFPAQSIKIGGTWYSYARIEPFATTVGMTIDAINALKRGKQSPNRAIGDLANAVRGQVETKTFLAGISDALMAFEGKTADAPARWASRFAVSWVPLSGMTRSAGRSMDDYQPERGVWGKGTDWAVRLAKRTAQNTEVMSWALPDQAAYDLWGRKIDRSQSPIPHTDYLYRMMVPSKNQAENVVVGDRLIINWNLAHIDDERYPGLPPKDYKVEGKTQYVTDEQYAQLLKASGELSRKVVEGWKWNNVENPTEADMDTLEDSISQARKAVRDQLINEWQGKGKADLNYDRLAADIRHEITTKHLDVLASRRPYMLTPDDRVKKITIQQKQAKFDEKVQKAADWLKARGMEPAEIRRAFSEHALKAYKEGDTRKDHFEILQSRLLKYKLAG